MAVKFSRGRVTGTYLVTDRDKEIMRLYLMGITMHKDIAEKLGIDRKTVTDHLNKPNVRSYLDRLVGMGFYDVLLMHASQDEIRYYYETLKKVADDGSLSGMNRVSAIKEMRSILEKYSIDNSVEIPKFIEVGVKKFGMMEEAWAKTEEAKERLEDGDPIEDILHLREEL